MNDSTVSIVGHLAQTHLQLFQQMRGNQEGDFPRSLEGMTDRKRAFLRAVIGANAEALVAPRAADSRGAGAPHIQRTGPIRRRNARAIG